MSDVIFTFGFSPFRKLSLILVTVTPRFPTSLVLIPLLLRLTTTFAWRPLRSTSRVSFEPPSAKTSYPPTHRLPLPGSSWSGSWEPSGSPLSPPLPPWDLPPWDPPLWDPPPWDPPPESEPEVPISLSGRGVAAPVPAPALPVPVPAFSVPVPALPVPVPAFPVPIPAPAPPVSVPSVPAPLAPVPPDSIPPVPPAPVPSDSIPTVPAPTAPVPLDSIPPVPPPPSLPAVPSAAIVPRTAGLSVSSAMTRPHIPIIKMAAITAATVLFINPFISILTVLSFHLPL